MYRGTWCATVHGVAKSQTQLSDKHFHLLFYMLTTFISSHKHDFTHLKYWFIPNLYLCNLRINIWEKWDLYYEIRYSVANYNFCYKILKQDNQIKKKGKCLRQIILTCMLSLFSSVAHMCSTPCNPMDCSMPGFPVHHQLPKITQTQVHWGSDAILHLIFCHPLPFQHSEFHSIKVFSNESILHIRWPKCWSFSFSISPSNEYPGLICFRMNWLNLLFIQGTLKSLLQHHSSKASILQCSAFFIVQFSPPYMTTGKTIVLTRWTFVGRIMSLLCNMLSRLVIAFLPRSKCLLISWLKSPSVVILEPPKIVCHYFHCFPIYLPWNDGTGCHDLHSFKFEF